MKKASSPFSAKGAFLAALLAGFAINSASAQTVISTYPEWTANNFVYYWGSSYFPTFGQTFTTPSDSSLNAFSFSIDDVTSSPIAYQAYVYAWNGSGITGSALFTGAPSILDPTSGFQTVSINTGNLDLQTGQQYVVFLTTTTAGNSTQGAAYWGTTVSSAYTGGSFVYDHGQTFTSLQSAGYDSAFSLSFSAPPPPPPPPPTLSTAYWLGNTNGSWTANNWASNASGTSANQTPSAGAQVIFSASGAANQTTTLGANTTIDSLTVNDTHAVTIGGTNTLTISNNSFTPGVTVNSGAGLLTISSGLAFAGTSQTVSVNNTAGAVINGSITGTLGLTKTGTGTLTLSGANSYTGDTYISAGTLAVSGAGSINTPNAVMEVGYIGNQSALNISNGGQVTTLSGLIGFNTGISGSTTETALVTGVNSNGTASTWSNTDLVVGYGSTGSPGSTSVATLTIQDGGQVNDRGLGTIAFLSGTTSTVTVTGVNTTNGITTSSTWKNLGTIVGWDGTGVLTVSDGATVISSQGVTLAQSSTGQGTLNLDSGGILETSSITRGSGAAVVNIDGGILQATANSTTFISNFQGGDAVTLASGGVTIDTNGYSVTASSVLSGSGGLTKIGAGTLTFTASNTYSGDTTINSGTVAVTGPTGGIRNNDATLTVGEDSGDNAALVISNGGQVSTYGGYVGENTGATGAVTVTGVDSADTASRWYGASTVVGANGTGSLDIEDGGNATLSGLTIDGVGSTVTVSGVNITNGRATPSSLTLNFSAGLTVGEYGTATLDIENGGQVTGSKASYVGLFSGSSGTVTVVGVNGNGTASTWSNSGDVLLGSSGTATLSVQDGGQVTNVNAYLGGANGSATVTGVNDNGTASTWSNSGILHVGTNGVGTLTISNGGVVSSQSTILAGPAFEGAQGTINLDSIGVLQTGSIARGPGPGGTAALNFNGGILRAAANSTDFLNYFQPGEVTINSGGGTIDSNGYAITASSPIGGVGTLTKAGAGTLTLSGANTYQGGTLIAGGTVDLDGSTGSLAAGSDLTFTATSAFNYDTTNAFSYNDKQQALGLLTFYGGGDTVISTIGNAHSTTLSFTSVTRATGATGNFVINDNSNGSTNGITSKIVISGIAPGFMSPGIFFGGNNYATYDANGFVRGINYGVDANSVVSAGGSSIAGSLSSSSNVELAGDITAQNSASINTLNLQSHDLTLGSGQTLTVNGILESGGSATISGGSAIAEGGYGGEYDMVVRIDQATDSLTINTAISASSLTKTGEGVLNLNSNFTGTTYDDGGALGIGAGTTITGNVNASGGSSSQINGTVNGNVSVGSGSTSQINGTVNGNVSVGSGSTIGGSGTVTGKVVVASGGSTYPGDPKISTYNNIEYQSGSKAQFAVDTTLSSSHPPTAGVDYDQIQLTGGPSQVLQIDPGTTTLQLNLTSTSLAALQSNASNNINDLYFVFKLGSGTSTGQFSDLTLTEGANTYTDAITNGVSDFASLSLQFDLSYTGNSLTDSTLGGNDVVFTVSQLTVTPEPSTWAMLLGGLGLLAFWRHRTRRALV